MVASRSTDVNDRSGRGLGAIVRQVPDPASLPARPSVGDRAPWVAAGAIFISQLVLHAGAADGYFHNPDDWYHLALARDALAGQEGAVSEVFAGHELRGFRVLPQLLWMLNWVLFGFEAAGYYWTNVLISGASAVAVFGLGVVLARAGRDEGARRRGTDGVLAGFVAMSTFALADVLHQEAVFLAARDDALATLMVCLAVLSWVAGRGLRSAIVGSLFFALACASKPVAIVTPVLFLAVDLAVRRAPWRDRALLLRFAAPAVVLLGFLIVARSLFAEFLAGSVTQHLEGPATLGNVTQNLYVALIAPIQDPLANAARGAVVVLAVVLGLASRAARPRLVALGAFWIAVNLAAPFDYMAHDPMIASWQGRYLLLASVGFGLVAAGFVSGPPRRGGRVLAAGGAVTVALFGVALLASVGSAQMGGSSHTRAEALVTDLGTLSDAHPEASRAVLAIQRPDGGLLSALASGVLDAAGPLGAGLTFYLEGSDSVFGLVPTPSSREIWHTYGRLGEADLDGWMADPEVLVIVEQASAPVFSQSGPPTRTVTYVAAPALPPQGAPPAPLPSWSFATGPSGWTSLFGGAGPGGFGGGPMGNRPSPQLWEAGALQITGFAPPSTMLGILLGLPGNAALLVSPVVEVPASSVCGLVVEIELPRGPPSNGVHFDKLLPTGASLALTWSTTPGVEGVWDHLALLPLPASGSARVRFALDDSPGWRSAGVVRRLGLHPNANGTVSIRSVELEACASADPASP